MDELRDNVACAADVRLQLGKMLDTGFFQNKPVQSMLLKYLVEMALANKPLRETAIGEVLFPGYQKEDDDVRIHTKNLRESLAKYYATEGAQDIVVIEIEKGPGYRATYSYSSNSHLIRSYSLGLHDIGILNDCSIGRGIRWLEDVEAMKPEFAAAYAAKAVAMLLYKTIYSVLRFNTMPPRDPDGRSAAETAIKIDPKQWLAHIALGGYHCCHWQWEEAHKCFEKALKLNQREASINGWYAAFLLAIGRKQEALDIVQANVKRKPIDLNARLTCGLFLYAAREYEEAEDVLRVALHLLPNGHWAASFLLGLNELGTYNAMSSFTARTEFRRAAELNMRTEDIFPGFIMLAHPEPGHLDYETLLESPTNYDKNLHKTPLNDIMMYMATARKDNAVTLLEQACAEHDPLMCWLHLWPVLDPLRMHPRFAALIARMNLPSKSA